MVFYNDTEIKNLNIDVEILSFYLIMLLTSGLIWLGCIYEVLNNSHNVLKLRLIELESFLTNEQPNIFSENKDADFSTNLDSYLKYRQNKIYVLDELRSYIDANNIYNVDELSEMLELKYNKFMVLNELRNCTNSNSMDDLKQILEFKLNRYSLMSDLRNNIKTINSHEYINETNEKVLDTNNLENMLNLNLKKNKINVIDELHSKINDNDIIDLDNYGNTINGSIFSNITNYFSSNSNSNSNEEKKNN